MDKNNLSVLSLGITQMLCQTFHKYHMNIEHCYQISFGLGNNSNSLKCKRSIQIVKGNEEKKKPRSLTAISFLLFEYFIELTSDQRKSLYFEMNRAVMLACRAQMRW